MCRYQTNEQCRDHTRLISIRYYANVSSGCLCSFANLYPFSFPLSFSPPTWRGSSSLFTATLAKTPFGRQQELPPVFKPSLCIFKKGTYFCTWIAKSEDGYYILAVLCAYVLHVATSSQTVLALRRISAQGIHSSKAFGKAI